MAPSSDLFALLAGRAEELARLVQAKLGELAFTNHYTLHPRRFAEIAREESEAFLRFVSRATEDDARVRGRALAQIGMGEKSVLSLHRLFRNFCQQTLGTEAREALDAALNSIDGYTCALTEGFIAAREEQILRNQEQLRRALSAALESQSQDLPVKNHAT